LKLGNVSKETLIINKLAAYYSYNEVIWESSPNKQLGINDFYNIEVTTTKYTTMLECFFWYHSWKLYIYYTTVNDNKNHVEIVKFGTDGKVLGYE
jgi:hypothetical protein